MNFHKTNHKTNKIQPFASQKEKTNFSQHIFYNT